MMKKTHLLLLVSVLLLLVGLLTACGTEQVTLTIVTNDGNESTAVQIPKGERYALPTPTRDGYAFVGWYQSEDFSGDPLREFAPSTDTTIYAKWNENAKRVTLDPAGGTLATASVMLSPGYVIADRLAALIPEKADNLFDTWLLDDEPLAADAVMGDEDITLVARYKIKYTIDVLLQNETLDGYEAQTPVVGYGYVNEPVVPTYAVKGYKTVTKTDSVMQLVLTEDASSNAFKLYFDRETYKLTFLSNYPDASGNTSKTESLVYGVSTKLPLVTFEKDGYYLEGWAESANGEMKYYSHVMDDYLHGSTPPAVESIVAEGNITLYAVWSKGYTDLFGGADIMYVSAGEADTVYLCRGGIYFKGRIRNGKTLFFRDSPDSFPEAVLNADGETFLYKDLSRAEVTATLYEMGADKGLNELVKLTFDAANGLTYHETDAEDPEITTESKGAYIFSDDGYIIATFTSGPLSGKTLTIAIGVVTDGSTRKTAFQIRNEEELGLGSILRFVVTNDVLTVYTDTDGNPLGDITLNGFGIATYNGGTSSTNYYYTYDTATNTITLMNSQGSVAAVLRLMEVNGDLGYMIYSKSMDVTYTLADGSTLTLDGIQTATYTVDGVAHSGYFTTASSAFGGTILTFAEDGVVYKFMLTSKKQETLKDPSDPESGTTTTTVVVVERKSAGYQEYYYRDEAGIYYAPFFVFETEDRSTVTIYGYNELKEYHKIAAGTLTFDATTGLYTLTVTETFTLPEGTSPVFTEPIDFSRVKSCVLMLDSTLTQYNIHFWFNYNNGVETFDKTQVFTGANGGKLTLVAGFAIYQIDDKTHIGTYKQSGMTLTASYADGTLYFTLDTEAKTYTVTSTVSASQAFYEIGKDGAMVTTSYLYYDGQKKVWNFCVITTDGETQSVAQYPGKLTNTGKTSLTGFTVYAFASDEKVAGTDAPLYAFEFIQRSISTSNYFFRYDAAYAGTYASTNTKNGVLTLDGFGFAATYTDGAGREIIGMYQKSGDQVLISSDSNYYFLLDGNTCKLRGSEYGRVYLLIDNQAFGGLYAEMDGLGGVTIFRLVQNGDTYDREPVDESGTYTVDGDRATLTYKAGAATHTLVVKFGTMTSGSTTLNALITIHDEVEYSYVNENDWSVLHLNSDGTAYKYLVDGAVESGTYSLVTETLLYYVNEAGTEAYIYVYDTEGGTATPRSYAAVAYYTADLDSLLFSQYGFAIFNNSVRYYYTVDENDNVTLYHLDENAAVKNRYGYVEEDFGSLSDIKDYDGKTYYKNDGFAIEFIRAEATKNNYPVQVDEDNLLPTLSLTFAPTGATTFTVAGTVMIGTETYDCVVVREVVDGVSRMYFTIGYFHFDITLHYQGDGVGSDAKSTYEVTGLSYVRSLPSYTYLYYLYYVYQMLGSSAANQFTNSFGVVSLYTEYNVDGSVKEKYLNATFGEMSQLLLSDGTLLESLDKVPLTALGSNFYSVTFTAADGYKYTMILVARPMQIFSTYGYSIYALLREEAVTANDGYTVTVSRVIASDIGFSTGAYYSFGLAKDGAEIEASNIVMVGGKLYYIVRETGEGAKTYYYQLTLVEKSSGTLEGTEGSDPEEGTDTPDGTTDETAKPLPLYESATVTQIEATTVLAADGTSFVDILPENKIIVMSLTTPAEGEEEATKTLILVTECTYDGENGVYTLKSSDDKTYTVTVTEEGVATITEITSEAGTTTPEEGTTEETV